MSTANFNLHVSGEGDGNVTFVSNGAIVTLQGDHPNFKRVVHALAEGNDPTEFLDVFKAISQASDRVTVDEDGSQVFYDGEPITNGVTKTILRYHNEGRDVANLARFLERVQTNPSRHSREQLWAWVNAADLHVDDEGRIVAWKSVQVHQEAEEVPVRTSLGEHDEIVEGSVTETYTSHNQGTAWVNGVEHTGRIPYAVGDVVTIPRELVQDDPTVHCSHGLHIGSYNYASTFGSHSNRKVMEVAVAPEDVVSVPNDHNAEKIRCCKFEVLAVQEIPSPDLGHYEPEATAEEWDEEEAEAAITGLADTEDEVQVTFLGRLLQRYRGQA